MVEENILRTSNISDMSSLNLEMLTQAIQLIGVTTFNNPIPIVNEECRKFIIRFESVASLDELINGLHGMLLYNGIVIKTIGANSNIFIEGPL